MSCDDTCTFKMSIDDPLNEDSKTELLRRTHPTEYRDHYVPDRSATSPSIGKVISEWVTLTEGQHYYVEATHGQMGGPTHMDVGMDIVPDQMPTDHPRF